MAHPNIREPFSLLSLVYLGVTIPPAATKHNPKSCYIAAEYLTSGCPAKQLSRIRPGAAGQRAKAGQTFFASGKLARLVSNRILDIVGRLWLYCGVRDF